VSAYRNACLLKVSGSKNLALHCVKAVGDGQKTQNLESGGDSLLCCHKNS
jgi:hypothetical protein